MTRRAAYLLTWGIVYVVLGVFLVETGESWIWEVHFGGAGVVSILAALTHHKWIDTAGFVLLTITSATRATFFLIDLVTGDPGFTSNLLSFVVWSGVATAQVIVSGWPDTAVEIERVSEGDSSGVE